MATEPDPYAVLGLPRGASLDEVKRAYRRLAKVNHPDAAGERNVARFLAIQSAYERLAVALDPTGTRTTSVRPGVPRRPWQADPDRSESTRRAYGGRGRTTGREAPNGRSRTSRPGDSPGSSEQAADHGQAAGDAADAPPSKATPGSTSYDGADAAPFEPDWGGASWYGTTSGTYWTLNPKEYADPRKHGPEYQARARRATHGPSNMPDGSTRGGKASPGADGQAAGPESTGPAVHTTSSWWESTAGSGTAAGAEPEVDVNGPAQAAGPTGTADAGGSAGSRGPAARPRDPASTARLATEPPPDVGRALADLGRVLTDERLGGFRGRLGRALVGWLPIALGIGWLVGEVTGCGRFSATCDPSAAPVTLVIQIAVFVLLVAVPTLGSISAMASVTLLAAAFVATLILSVNDGQAGDARRTTLGLILVVGWLVGATIAIAQRIRPGHGPARPVS